MNTSSPHVLILGTVWPEPTSSAAGLHHWSLIHAFQQVNWKITYLSPSAENQFCRQLQEAGIHCQTFLPNDSRFDDFIRQLQPEYAVFDRFILEEQFGWRIKENSPETVRIVDTEDLHFLRRTRHAALKAGVNLDEIFRADLDFNNDDFLREIASIYRSDCALMISDFEMELLKNRFSIPETLLHFFRFCYGRPPAGAAFEDRKNFVMIGNFRHPPNVDATHWLQQDLWPKIRQEFSRRGSPYPPEVHIYGAYPSREIMNLHDPSTGFHIKGPAEDQYEALAPYRVNLAPLRFGAGIKGKIADGWWCGLPVVTTPIGSEGMHHSPAPESLGGLEARTSQEFAQCAAEIYLNKDLWLLKQTHGLHTLETLFDAKKNYTQLISDLERVRKNIRHLRNSNFIGAMLWHHAHKSTTYFSRWIELKNKLNTLTGPIKETAPVGTPD